MCIRDRDMAISLEFFKTELILIKSSGAEVAIDTTVRPITTLDILYFNDRSTEDFNK